MKCLGGGFGARGWGLVGCGYWWDISSAGDMLTIINMLSLIKWPVCAYMYENCTILQYNAGVTGVQ